MDDGKITCNWAIEIVTPVHVGSAQEKHWQNNLDFIIRGNKVYFLDEAKIISEYGIDKYSNAVANGKILNLQYLENNISKFSYRKEYITGKTKEIKQQIKNSLSNKPIIPGSSLKGAIRSVFFKYLYKKNEVALSGINNWKKLNENIFGTLSKDFMKYIEVFDIEFEKTEIFNTKIYNLTRNNDRYISVWKDGFNNNHHKFSSNRFTTGYECISPGEIAKLKIVFNKKAYDTAKSKNLVHNINGVDDVLNDDFKSNLLKIIKTHTDNYLDKELEFFNKYKQAEYGYDVYSDIKHYVEELKEKKGLRLAVGSGFHSITGDWQFDTHEIDWIDNRNHRGKYNRKPSAKSRKLAFEKGEDGNIYFYPMGLISVNNDS